ncbi:MAG: FtsX-like permease family protein [Chitinophagaceae bacterium]
MFKSYFKIAFRNLKKNKLYTFVNITGLTVGIVSCILIGLYISHELSYDKFNKNADRIVRVTMDYGGNGTSEKVAVTGTKVGPQFKRTFPSVQSFCRVIKHSQVVAYSDDKLFDEKNFLYADSSFFQIFSFQLLQGDAKTVLNAPDKVVLTKHIAEKYFGNENAVGKTLRLNNNKDYQVTGIAADVPGNSQIQFDFIASFGSLDVSKNEEWWSANYITYLLLNKPENIAQLQNQIASYMKTKVAKELDFTGSDYLTYHLEPLKKVHLYSSLEGLEPNGNISYIYILGIVAFLILLIACINYTNLATAQSASRSAEIGIRKVFGAHKWQLFYQFISESAVLTFVALISALFVSIELLPLFNSVSGKSLTAGMLLQPLPIIAMIFLGIIVTVFAGGYPSIILSNSKLINILKSGFRISSSGGGLRKSLIVFQFVISIFLIATTIIILQQLSFIQHKNLGYDKEHIIVLPVDKQVRENYDAIKKAVAANPNVVSVSGGYESPVFVQWGDGISVDNGGVKKGLMVNAMPVDLDYIKTMGMQIIAGSDYTLADLQQIDTSNNEANLHYTYMLNETAAKAIGWTPEQAIGKTITKGVSGQVKAVVKDFHIASLHEPIKPVVIFLAPRFVNDMFIKVSGKNIPSTIQFLQSVWKERVPQRPFEYHFLDEEYNNLYIAEQRTAQVFGVFSTIAILLACLGLFALAAFTTMQRTKEIGIRKVLGASLANITTLVSTEFLKLVFIAIIIATPLAWWASQKWIQNFAYRINLQWWVFALAGICAVIIALVTVSYHAIKAAMANPVNSLRTE